MILPIQENRAVTADINLSANDALDETQVGNKINMSYDMTYFDKQEKHSIMPTKLFVNISK